MQGVLRIPSTVWLPAWPSQKISQCIMDKGLGYHEYGSIGILTGNFETHPSRGGHLLDDDESTLRALQGFSRDKPWIKPIDKVFVPVYPLKQKLKVYPIFIHTP